MKIGKWEITWEQMRYMLLWIALPVLVGVLVSAAIPRPVIGILHIDSAIDSYSARTMVAQIDYARLHPEIRAVVLMVDSPGGTVAGTESVYQELLRLRRAKPVVTCVGSMAASGAYYLSVATDYIIANPTAEVGNVGVIGTLPDTPTIFDSIVSTGPYKLWGEPRDSYLREMEAIKQSFYQAVQLGRGDRLQIGPEVVLTGRIWLGSEAVKLGLVDALGSQSDALEKAASLAHVGHYQVANLAELAGTQSAASSFFFQSPEGVTLPYPSTTGIFLLYIPPFPVEK